MSPLTHLLVRCLIISNRDLRRRLRIAQATIEGQQLHINDLHQVIKGTKK